VSVIVGPAKDAFYLTQFVEIGTVKQRRQDWLLKSYRQTKDQVERRFADRMGQKIEQLAGNSSQ
jgi:HK97 gp10 family phage protein